LFLGTGNSEEATDDERPVQDETKDAREDQESEEKFVIS
jgi:hypothetical protein